MNYQERLLKHLADYRANVLGVETPGVFRYRGKDLPKGHVLPIELQWHNILPTFRDQVRSFVLQRKHIKLHRYFHHLNSSQALALNLFVPYFEGGPSTSAPLLRQLGEQGDLVTWDLEAVPVPTEETNIDVTWITSSGVRTLCEVKLSEAEFGTAVQDEEHLIKLRDTYSPLLCEYLPTSFLEPAMFCEHYQILRNVWHMVRLENGRLLFLLPRANAKLWASLQKAINSFPGSLRARITVITLEDVIIGLCAAQNCSAILREHAAGLRTKYLGFNARLTDHH